MIVLFPILLVLLVTTIIVIFNFFTAPVLKVKYKKKGGQDLVSVLIPARNESNNIENCLNKIINQRYNNLEIIVLDDESQDNTFSMVSEYTGKDKRIRIIRGKVLPWNYTGKNWACHQLSLEASGKYLVFIDADVFLEEYSLVSAISEMNKYRLDLLSVFPSQKMNSLGEWLLVPLMNWLLLTFLPIKLVYSAKSNSFAAANGQFMLFKRDTYENIGGHKSVSDKVTEDIEFARLLKKHRYRVKTFLGGELIYCRMYNGFRAAFSGFSKNFYAGTKLESIFFITLITFLFMCFTLPLIPVFSKPVFILSVITISLQRILISLLSRQHPIINLLLHPFQIVMFFVAGINSLIVSKHKRRIWKGRTF